MKTIWFDSITYQGIGSDVETSHKFASIAKPDEAYTIEELLVRHREGLLTDLEIGRQPIFPENDAEFDDPDLEKLRNADLVDKAEFVRAGQDYVAAVNEKKEKEAVEAAKRAEEDRIGVLVQERLSKTQ